ncbi:MAG TPA: glycosyltransferase family A protein [Candidatus Eisenbacteria bacterium]|nr:glycosyltransferase family A protein [Candidatus Eisenbacteria bacterium]
MTRYVVITPIRDEAKYIQATMECVSAQTVRPAEWVIVDDGSTDGTGEIVDQYASHRPWIHVVHHPNRGYRKSGGGVVEAFNEGYAALRCEDWDFMVKLDGDLTFAPEYFERCFEHFRQRPKLGIGGGEIYHELSGELTLESNPRFHVRGATKIYRRACWNAIGGLWLGPGWDTIDEVKANMLGWESSAFVDLCLVHHRITGAADGFARDRAKHGAACYISGYHPLFVAASCLWRLARKPYIVGSLALLYGYLAAFARQTPRVNDPSLIRYMQTQQIRRLFGLQTIWR